MDQEVKARVLAFLDERGPVPGDTEEEKLACEYLDVGVVDSMAIVELVTQLEDDYGIRFEPEDMQSMEFRTVGGLIETVERLRGDVRA